MGAEMKSLGKEEKNWRIRYWTFFGFLVSVGPAMILLPYYVYSLCCMTAGIIAGTFIGICRIQYQHNVDDARVGLCAVRSALIDEKLYFFCPVCGEKVRDANGEYL